tara:strand:- start:250 stop:615 length:366 start_codon:yes stop_codon:yes gene_type:complete
MATRSRIAVELDDGTVKSVYCHWDGYPNGVGQDLLNQDFSTTEQVERFIDEGSRSTVDESYYEKYGESRGEKLEKPDVHSSVDDYYRSDIEEYGYLFTNEGEWHVKSAYSSRIDPVENVIE